MTADAVTEENVDNSLNGYRVFFLVLLAFRFFGARSLHKQL